MICAMLIAPIMVCIACFYIKLNYIICEYHRGHLSNGRKLMSFLLIAYKLFVDNLYAFCR